MALLDSIKNAFAQDLFKILPLLNSQLRFRTGIVLMLIILQSLSELGLIVTLSQMSLALTNSEALYNNFIYKSIFYMFPILKVWTSDPRYLLLLTGFFVIVSSVAKNIFGYVAGRESALLSEDISLFVGREIMSRFLYRNYAWHLSDKGTSMFQKMLWRSQLCNLLSTTLMMFSTLITVLILCVSLVGQEPFLTSLIIIIVVATGILLLKLLRKSVDISAEVAKESAVEETKTLMCANRGIREVLIYRQQETFLQFLVNAALKGRKPRMFQTIAPTLPTWILEAVGFVVVIFAVAVLVVIQDADIAHISAVLTLLILTAWRVLPACNRVVSYQLVIRALRPMAYDVLHLLEELRATPMEEVPEPDKNFIFDKEICLKHIHFRYSDAKDDSLKDINLTLTKGEKVGLIGSSGGGKSTLAALLSGLLPASQGSITVDNKELTPERAAALAAKIGFVPQSPFLFAGTLAENVAFSEWGKPWNEERVTLACRRAAIDFVETHPKKLNRPIGDNGVGLSGGQAQRISIARALYAEPSLLIFDEATSALDQHNEKAIQDTIETLAENVTCLIIAHRLSTVQKCDKLLWLEEGRIVMQGNAEEVLAEYAKYEKTKKEEPLEQE